MCSFPCKKMERLLQGKIPSVLAFLQTVVHAAVKGLLARSDPFPKRFFKGRGSIMVVVRWGSCSYDKMNLALAGLNPLIGVGKFDH
jgi:hypothetical protein